MNNVYFSASIPDRYNMNSDKAYLSSNFRKETRYGDCKGDAPREQELGEIKNVARGGNTGKVELRTSYYTKVNVIILRLIFFMLLKCALVYYGSVKC